jgi:dephospho-CoA kinase
VASHRYTVVVTGGVASGKSAVCERLATRGVPVVDADVAARAVVEPGEPALGEIVQAFGPEVIDAGGRLDRRRLREIVFTDRARRSELEAIVHPRVRAWLKAAVDRAVGPYVAVAIPLLVEGGGRGNYPWIDRVLVVDVAPAIQVERLMRRDGVDRALADAMLAAQASRERRLAAADDVIVNDGDLAQLHAAVDAIDARYRQLAQAPQTAAPL